MKNKSKNTKRKPVSVLISIPEYLHETIKYDAKHHGTTVTGLIREVLKNRFSPDEFFKY